MSRGQPTTQPPGRAASKQPPDWGEIERAPWFQEFGMEAREAVLEKWQGDVRDWLRETGQLADETRAKLDQDVEYIRRQLRPTAGERVASGFAAAGRGFTEMVPGVMEGVSVAAQSLRRSGKPADESMLYQAAQEAREWTHDVLPIDPRVRESFWNVALPQAIGSFGSYILGGGAAGTGARLGVRAAVRGTAKGTARREADRITVFGNLVRDPERAIAQAQTTAQTGFALSAAGTSGIGQAYSEARQFGATEEDARKAGFYALGPGMFQVFGALRALGRFNRASRGRLERSYGEYLRQGGKGAIDEFIAESAGQVGFNAIAREIYDEERDLLLGAVKSGAAAGIAGFAASFLLSALGGRRSGTPHASDLREVYRIARDSTREVEARSQVSEYRERREREGPIIERVWNQVMAEHRGERPEGGESAQTPAQPESPQTGEAARPEPQPGAPAERIRSRLRQMTPDRPEAARPPEEAAAPRPERPTQRRAERPERPARDVSEAMPSAVRQIGEMDLSASALHALDQNLRFIVAKPKTWRAKPENISRLLGQTVLAQLNEADKQALVDEFTSRERGREALEAFRSQIEAMARQKREAEPAQAQPEPQSQQQAAEEATIPPDRWHTLDWSQVREQAARQGIGTRTARRRHVEAIQEAEAQGEIVSDLIRSPYRQALDQAQAARERADLERRAEEGDQEAQEQLAREEETAAISREGDPDTELLNVVRQVRLPTPEAARGMNLRGEAEALQRHFSRADIPRHFTGRGRTDAEILEQFAEHGHHFETVAELFDAVENRIESGREVFGRGDAEAIRFARRESPAARPPAPAEYLGRMEGAGFAAELYNLTEAVAGTPADSTVTAEFLQENGYRLPETAGEGEGEALAEEIRRALPLEAIRERTGLRVEILERQNQLPADILQEADGDIVDGVTDGASVWLVAENLGTAAQAEAKLAHEVVGHVGIRGVLGDRFEAFMDEAAAVFRADPGMSEAVARVARDYRLDLNRPDHQRLLAEELIAEMAEGGPVNRTVLDRIVEAVRRFLREIGVEVQMSEADILNALEMARGLTMPAATSGATGASSYTSETLRRSARETSTQEVGAVNRRDARLSARRGVPEVSRDTFAGRDGWRRAREWASANLEGRTVGNRESGLNVILRKTGLKHGTMPSAIPEKLAAVRVLPELIENARYLGPEADRYGRRNIRAVHRFQAPLRIDGESWSAQVVATESAEGNLYYDHVVIRGGSEAGGTPGEFTPPSGDPSTQVTGTPASESQDRTRSDAGQAPDADRPRFARRRRDEDLNDSEDAVYDTFRVPPEELTGLRLNQRYNWLTEEIDKAKEAGDSKRVNQLLGPRAEARAEIANRKARQEREAEEPPQTDRAPTEQEQDLGAAGIDPDDLVAPTINRMLTLRAFHESGTDTLYRSNTFRPLAYAIENQLDKRDGYLGALYGLIRPGIRGMRGLSRGERQRVKQEFERFWAENDVGDKGVAAEILDDAHPHTRELVEQWRIVAEEAFRVARAVGVKVQDPDSKEVHEMGQVRDYFPRMFNQEASRALREPHRHPETWNRLVDALIAEGHIQQREDAQRYINDYFTDETTNDFFANIERHRKQPLPRIFYDYSIARAVEYINRFAERTSQIEFYGQVVKRNDLDLFDKYIRETTDQTSREYVDAIRKRVYNQNPRDFATKRMADLNLLAAGSMLGNPLTASRNLVGGMTLTAENYGLLRSARELFDEIRNYREHATEAYERGVLKSDLLHVMRDNDMAHTKVFGLQLSDGLRKYTDFMMKYGGYTPTENFIRVHAMLTSKSFIRDAIRAANKNPMSQRALRYRAFFQRNRMDFDAVLRDGLDSPAGDAVIRRMVKIPQGSYEVDNVPVFIDTHMGRFLFKYQKFGTQVSRFFFRNMFGPFIRSLRGGENVRVRMPDGTETTARVRNFVPMLRFFTVGAMGGLAMEGLIHLLFGTHPKGPSLEELEKALDDDETARGLALMFDRAYMGWLYSGGPGIYGDYIQAGVDVYRRQRVRSPTDPPGLDALKRVAELGLRYFEQGTLTATDIRRQALEFNSGYRAWSHFTYTQSQRVGFDWEQAQLYAAWRERQWAQGVVGRYADENDIEGRIRAAGRYSHSEMSPVNQRLYNAVMLGKAAEARAIAEEYLRGLDNRDAMQRAYRSMQSSIRARQPLRVISSAGEADRLLFLEWAEANLGPGDRERLRRLDSTYREAAIRAGLLRGDEERARREIQREEYRTREIPEYRRESTVREIVR